MKKIPYCNQCKYYGGKGICNHPEHGGKYPHINREFWCRLGEWKEGCKNDL